MSAVHPGQYRGPCGRGIFALSSWKVPLKRPESLRESKAGKMSDFINKISVPIHVEMYVIHKQNKLCEV